MLPCHDSFVSEASILEEQILYYKARAGEYDEWALRQGRYDRGVEANCRWFAEMDVVRMALADAKLTGDVLEVAAGTGIWTIPLLESAQRVTALDTSAEVLDICHEKAGALAARLTTIQASIFEWEPERKFDHVFFGFWLSHVPDELSEAFWMKIRSALKPGGTVFLVDSLYTQESTAKDHVLKPDQSGVVERKLNDGRTFRVVKIFYTPEILERKLGHLGWKGRLASTETYFVYGSLSPSDSGHIRRS
jgi:demethylmenaquinone methyltransferase/2-methoxy-6-polyprenyl-1,4-benzoquinol methylase